MSAPENAVAVNDPAAVELEPGQRASARSTPIQSDATFAMRTLAASKHPGTTYEIKCDGVQRYGPAPVPPTDVDDLQQTFFPPLEWSESMTVTIRNVGAQTRTYIIQAIGWEE